MTNEVPEIEILCYDGVYNIEILILFGIYYYKKFITYRFAMIKLAGSCSDCDLAKDINFVKANTFFQLPFFKCLLKVSQSGVLV